MQRQNRRSDLRLERPGDRPRVRFIKRQVLHLLVVGLAVVGLLGLTSCSLPQVRAEDRIFLDLSLDFLDTYELPTAEVNGIPIGGLSGVVYDRGRDRFYAISDDRSNYAPARFYTLRMALEEKEGAIAIQQVEVESATTLTADGEPYPEGAIDAEGIALSPRQSLFISSEGVADEGIPPFVNEFDLGTGELRRQLRLPERYVPQVVEDQPQGVQNNAGFESLALSSVGFEANYQEPFRLFVATESALQQDRPPGESLNTVEQLLSSEPSEVQGRNRVMHYLVGENQETLLSEHLYLMEPDPAGAISNGLSELLVLDQGGHFLSLERSFGRSGFGVKLFQLAMGSATDTSGIATLSGAIDGLVPIRKRLLLDLNTLGIRLDNLEGMTLGPRLPDGSDSLILLSDNNFSPDQVTQFLLFRLRQP